MRRRLTVRFAIGGLLIFAGCSFVTDDGGLAGGSIAPTVEAGTDAAPSPLDGHGPSGLDGDATSGDATPGDPSLVGEWLFDEPGGNVARDTSGRGRDGRLTGTAKLGEPGTRNNALTLDGAGSVVVDALGGEAFPSTGTLSFFMHSDLDANDPAGGNIFDEWDSSRAHIYVRRSGGPAFQFSLMGPGDQYAIFVEFTPPAQQWVRVVLTWSAETQDSAIYLDGRRVGAGPNGYPFTPKQQRMMFGSTFRGRLDDVRLHDRAFSAVEVAAIP